MVQRLSDLNSSTMKSSSECVSSDQIQYSTDLRGKWFIQSSNMVPNWKQSHGRGNTRKSRLLHGVSSNGVDIRMRGDRPSTVPRIRDSILLTVTLVMFLSISVPTTRREVKRKEEILDANSVNTGCTSEPRPWLCMANMSDSGCQVLWRP